MSLFKEKYQRFEHLLAWESKLKAKLKEVKHIKEEIALELFILNEYQLTDAVIIKCEKIVKRLLRN